jgi:hypothetical protein
MKLCSLCPKTRSPQARVVSVYDLEEEICIIGSVEVEVGFDVFLLKVSNSKDICIDGRYKDNALCFST